MRKRCTAGPTKPAQHQYSAGSDQNDRTYFAVLRWSGKSYRTGSADSVGYVRIDRKASRSGFPTKLQN